ncbi:hypothetical protein KY289_013554 [Solanum tuberosum]|nr:hypothetical protein KY289_013554 [Solanum tuberosum]
MSRATTKPTALNGRQPIVLLREGATSRSGALILPRLELIYQVEAEPSRRGPGILISTISHFYVKNKVGPCRDRVVEALR